MGGLLIFDIETTGLDPNIDQIVGVGFKGDSNEKIFLSKYEKNLIKNFWDYLPKKDITLVSFDSDITLPFLLKRTTILGLEKHPLKALDLHKVFRFKDSKNFDITFFKPNKNIILWKKNKNKILREYILSTLNVTYNIINIAKESKLL